MPTVREQISAPSNLLSFQKESRKHPAKLPIERLDWLVKYAESIDVEIDKSLENSLERIALLRLSVRVWKNISSTIKLIEV